MRRIAAVVLFVVAGLEPAQVQGAQVEVVATDGGNAGRVGTSGGVLAIDGVIDGAAFVFDTERGVLTAGGATLSFGGRMTLEGSPQVDLLHFADGAAAFVHGCSKEPTPRPSNAWPASMRGSSSRPAVRSAVRS
jgi:hypothetical protein